MAGKLTPKQEMFVREYLVDLNAKRAATAAGYSAKTAEQQGYQLLQHPSVAAAIKEAMDKRAKKVEINAEFVLGVVLETIDRCRQVTPVIDRKGNPVMVETPDGDMAPAYVFDAAGVLRGAELLGKHIGLFPNKIDVTVTDQISSILESARRRASETKVLQ